jgi:type III secretion protein J
LPTPGEERLRALTDTAAALERTLGDLPGVSVARVHLGASEGALRASVLLHARPDFPESAERAVQRLVAGAVPGLAADQVTVVLAPAVAQPAPTLAHFGPFEVAPRSLPALRALVLALLCAIVVLAGALLVCARRLFRATAGSA